MLQECLPVITNARKLIIQVPQSDKVVTFPKDAVISPHGQNNANPTVVVFNATDEGGTWQGADSQNGIVIINAVTELDAEVLLNGYDETMEGLGKLIAKAVKFGYRDMYTTSVPWARTKLTPAGKRISTYTGLVMRSDKDITYVYWDNDRIMVQSDLPRAIEPEILQRDYRNLDGSQISLSQIP